MPYAKQANYSNNIKLTSFVTYCIYTAYLNVISVFREGNPIYVEVGVKTSLGPVLIVNRDVSYSDVCARKILTEEQL